ncbi:hypothetical protein C0J52_04342 [Blattella germanica]|nr:hypothetical protein C0J52_04342 [Blattella germanica]
MERIKASFLKKALGLSKFTPSRITYLLSKEPFYLEELRLQRLLTATRPYKTVMQEMEAKRTEIWQDLYSTDAMMNEEWKKAEYELRHVVTRFAAHGFHHKFCCTDKFHQPSDDCTICKLVRGNVKDIMPKAVNQELHPRDYQTMNEFNNFNHPIDKSNKGSNQDLVKIQIATYNSIIHIAYVSMTEIKPYCFDMDVVNGNSNSAKSAPRCLSDPVDTPESLELEESLLLPDLHGTLDDRRMWTAADTFDPLNVLSLPSHLDIWKNLQSLNDVCLQYEAFYFHR